MGNKQMETVINVLGITIDESPQLSSDVRQWRL